MSILSMQDLRKNFGATEIIRGVDLDIETGEKHAIIGPNGAGKSTLFHLISGKYAPTAGSIRFKDQPIENLSPYQINRLGVARSFQVTNIFPRLSVFENIRCALLWTSGYGYSFRHLLDRQRALNENTGEVLEKIGLAGKAQIPAGEIAYSEQRALELGMAIAGGAELILLDEPVAGMSHSEADNAVRLIRKVHRRQDPGHGRTRHEYRLRPRRPHQRTGVRRGHRLRRAGGNPRQCASAGSLPRRGSNS